MIFSIAMGARYLIYMKSTETHARAFLALIILPIGTVGSDSARTFDCNPVIRIDLEVIYFAILVRVQVT